MLLVGLLLPTSAAAHDPSLPRTVPVYIAVGPAEVRVLVRVPLELLGGLDFVRVNREIQTEASAPALAASLLAIDAWLTLAEGPAPLVASERRAHLTLPVDRSFDSHDLARARFDRPPTRADTVFIDQGFLDAALTFPLREPAADLAVSLRPSVHIPSAVRAAVRVVTAEGAGRLLMVTSRSGRVALQPTVATSAWRFLSWGLRRVGSDDRYLLLLFCLMAVLRTPGRALPFVVMLSVGRSAAIVGTAYSLGNLGGWVVGPVEAAAILSVAAAALALVLDVELHRRLGLAAFLGLLHGLSFSFGLRDELPLAGGHDLPAVLSYNAGLEAGQLGASALVVVVLGRLRQTRGDSLLVVLMVTTLLGHVVWHDAIDGGLRLWSDGLGEPDAASALILARWAAGVGVAAAAAGWILGRRTDREARRRMTQSV
jgi:hypothetical protein